MDAVIILIYTPIDTANVIKIGSCMIY